MKISYSLKIKLTYSHIINCDDVDESNVLKLNNFFYYLPLFFVLYLSLLNQARIFFMSLLIIFWRYSRSWGPGCSVFDRKKLYKILFSSLVNGVLYLLFVWVDDLLFANQSLICWASILVILDNSSTSFPQSRTDNSFF